MEADHGEWGCLVFRGYIAGKILRFQHSSVVVDYLPGTQVHIFSFFQMSTL